MRPAEAALAFDDDVARCGLRVDDLSAQLPLRNDLLSTHALECLRLAAELAVAFDERIGACTMVQPASRAFLTVSRYSGAVVLFHHTLTASWSVPPLDVKSF